MRRLLIFAYAFDEKSQVFSHQIGVIKSLSKQFDQTVVIATRVGLNESQEYSKDPKSNDRLIIIEVDLTRTNSTSVIFQRYLKLILFLNKYSFHAVFHFMTETSALLFGLYFKARRIRQILWYAHANKSYRLVISSRLVDLICSSTKGSIPLNSSKIRLLGQMVDDSVFTFSPKDLSKNLRLIHYGRFDTSKDIGTIFQVVERLSFAKIKIYLTIIGSPSTERETIYQKNILDTYAKLVDSKQVVIMHTCLRSELPHHLNSHDIFIHAYQGSLDKSIVEATLMGVPVVTLNQEYLRQFGSWSQQSKPSVNNRIEFLMSEVEAVKSLDSELVKMEIDRRYRIALASHTLNNWVKQMNELLIDSEVEKR